MAKQVQRRRGTTAQMGAFTPALGEINVDTTRKGIVVGDGATLGGIVTPNLAEVEALVEAAGIGGTNVQIYTSSDSWAKPSGLVRVRVTVIGAGGGGGSCPAVANCRGSGGAAGGFSQKIIEAAALGATETVTIGAGGASEAAGDTTSFGAHLQATGGSPGLSGNGGLDVLGGRTGGVGSGGTINAVGGSGEKGLGSTGEVSGEGGASHFGRGAAARTNAGVGNAAVSPGSGGGGARTVNAGDGPVAGGAGKAGIVIVEEFH